MEDTDAAADLLEAALFGSEELLDQATVDLSVELPLIEGYKLLKLLGEGGFGMVYEAEQRMPIRRRVALKVLRPGSTTRELLARFEQERQMLALLNHPHIARIFDAGETEDGRPFIAMELVNGSTIDRHAKKLGEREKISLMRDVCRAVGHAHRKGIIHRDLKPSNILITQPEDGPAEPRVIDFGIAKALDGPLSAKVMFTQIRQIVGTPGYMSPERQHTSQIRHSADTRTDVFALGAILWELLTGQTPQQAPDGETTRITLPDAKSVPAELRWIAEKATDADMEHRYGNADSLADDLDAWLNGHPLVAAPRSTLYVLGKWAARHRVAAASITIMAATLILSFILILRSHRQMSMALNEAESSHHEMEQAISQADYLMGVTRERFRPVHAMAHWARALRHDPSNAAASGMLLSALKQRSYPHRAAPAARLPEGVLRHLAVSSDGKMAALVLGQENQEILACVRRGEAQASAHPIPADGRMTHLAVSHQKHVAVAGDSGVVGLLQKDGSWLECETTLKNLRGLVWNSQDHLWIIGEEEIALCDESGKQTRPSFALPGQLQRWNTTPSGDKIVLGLEAGRLLLFDSAEEQPQELQAPIPAPFTTLAVNDAGHVSAGWRSDKVWMHHGEETRLLTVLGLKDLNFMPGTRLLLARTPQGFMTVDQSAPQPISSYKQTQLFKSALPLEGGRVLLQTTAGRLSIHEPQSERAQEIPGTSGREQHALANEGRIIVLVDQDERSLEWLRPFNETSAPTQHTFITSWLALRPSAQLGAWHGIDANGVIFETGAAGTTRELWRLQDAKPRIAALSADAVRVIYDDDSGPGMLCAKRGEAPVHRLWGKASTMALSPDGSIAALGFPTGKVTLWDMDSGKELQTQTWNRGAINTLTFVNTERLAFAASGQVRVWEWRTGRLLPHSLDFPGIISALAADSAGERIALATNEGALHVLDTTSGLRVCGQLPAARDTTCLLWDESDLSLWSFASTGQAQQIAPPPLLQTAPDWLPDHAEQRIGMQVDDQGRVVRLRTSKVPQLPAAADATLKAWLE
jgi:serine/threonine protein kinase